MNATLFGDAYVQGLKRTLHFLLSRGVPHDVAPDIAQSAWLRGWERREQLRDESMIFSWINSIALNHFRRTLRGRRREEELRPAHYDIRATELNEAAIDIARIVDACTPKDRDLLQAQLLGITAKELANTGDISQTAIRIRLMRARRSARQLCEPRTPLLRAA